MDEVLTLKERHLTYNTLVCLLMTLKGQQTTVDLRNRSSVTGTVARCDAYMNVEMTHVLFRDASGKPHVFENFFVQARNLRYVHIPPQVDMRKSVEKFFDRNRVRKTDSKISYRAMRQQAETVERVRKLKEKAAMKQEEAGQ
ncbi:hypothetical protein ONE63_000311 [Megalurothrips usitatus]|uniref:Sm domain-containing protein n=1 Tax=Megalurothrips usitatus TaxID=439358 RepID=A0AAV7Y1X6_9NEOP|nr:hypothetical protein ONE63_000311 [Megalurothrips usitatus]